MAQLYENAISKLGTVANINAVAGADTLLYTPPAGKSALISWIVFRCTSFTVGTKTTQAAIVYGTNNPAYDNYYKPGNFNNITFSQTGTFNAVTAWDGEVISNDPIELPLVVTASPLYLHFNAASDATVEVWSADIFGYLM